MFDIGWQELFLIAVLALIVVGPKDLPQAIRTITIWIRKARLMARDFQSGVNEMVREAELDDLKDQLTKPRDLKKSFIDTLDPDGKIAKGLTLDEADEKKLGSVPIKGASSHDMENMTVSDASDVKEGDPLEAGEAHQFAAPARPLDEDVMPISAPASDAKPESKP